MQKSKVLHQTGGQNSGQSDVELNLRRVRLIVDTVPEWQHDPVNDDDLYTGQDGHWRALPRWAKGISVFVGLPAWLTLMIGVFSGRPDTHLILIAFGAFAGVAILQTVLLFRAYWRMEL